MIGRKVNLNGKEAVEIKYLSITSYYWETNGRYFKESISRETLKVIQKARRISREEYNAALFIQ